MWDPPGSGIEPMSPALAGRFFTPELPGKPYNYFLQLKVQGLFFPTVANILSKYYLNFERSNTDLKCHFPFKVHLTFCFPLLDK